MQNEAKILVVDDTPTNLKVITETLTSAGYQVATAISGDRALKRLQAYRPDLILLDVQMPGIDGFETCQQIKAHPDLADIPIIFITALSDSENTMQGFSLGAVDYINKPFREPELLARVKTHLRLQQMTHHLEQQVAERTQALESALADLQSSQMKLVQQEKMSALGSLVAGVAHEINNPAGCIVGNVEVAQDYINNLLGLIDLYGEKFPNPGSEIAEEIEAIDLKYVREDLPDLIRAMKDGGDRIKSISHSLRIFSRANTEYTVSANLHEGIDSTLLILKYRLKANEYRPEIQIRQQYGDFPSIQCFPGQLNQVFMNILANAIDMFDEIAQQSTFTNLQANPQTITIQTGLADPNANPNTVEIRIRDNGKGMSEDLKARIFDHLFTTKGVGKGTGLGLAIARQIVVEKHGGSIEVQSELGQGTEFYMRLPIQAE